VETKLYTVDEFLNTDYHSRNIAIIGRGKGNDAFLYNPEKIFVISINDSCLFYPGQCETAVIVQAHFEKNFPLVNGKVKNILKFNKADMVKNKVITGCTPSIFLSFLIKTGKVTGRNVYLQGFPLEGPSHDEKFPYDFNRQFRAFNDCFSLADQFNVNMKFVTPSERFSEKHYSLPEGGDLIK